MLQLIDDNVPPGGARGVLAAALAAATSTRSSSTRRGGEQWTTRARPASCTGSDVGGLTLYRLDRAPPVCRQDLSRCSSAATCPRRAGSTRRSTGSRRSAATACRCSRRARACGGRPRTSPRRSSGSAAARRGRASAASSATRSTSCNLAARRRDLPEVGRRRCARRSRPRSAIEADAVIFHVGSHLGAGFEASLEQRRAGARRRSSTGCDGDTWLAMENSAGPRRDDRPLDRRARDARRRARPPSAARDLPRLVPPVRLRLRRPRPRRGRRARRRGRRDDRPRPAARAPRQRQRDPARLEPRPAREHPRGRDRRGPRRLPRPPGVPGARRLHGGRRAPATASTRTS